MKKRLLGILLSFALMLTMMPVLGLSTPTYADDAPHTHDSITFQEWTSSNSLPSSGGSYYLTNNVTLSSSWNVTENISLCLNGHTITGPSSEPGSFVIHINGTGTLKLYDCNSDLPGHITGGGNGVYIDGGTSTFNMYGGVINGNSAYYGGGVLNYGTFTMNGGTITGNNAEKGGGVRNSGMFNMYGGVISNNTASESEEGGGGIYNSGTFNMYGGVISNNTASDEGGGIYNSGMINLSGKPTITGNTVNNVADNVYLESGKKITIKDILTTGASVGVKMESLSTFTSEYKKYNEGTEPSKFFSSDDDRYIVALAEDGEAQLAIGFTVTFDANGHGTAPDSQPVATGNKATKPEDPTAQGYTFGGWYKEAACETQWNFDNDTVTADTTLYAKWTEKPEPTPPTPTPTPTPASVITLPTANDLTYNGQAQELVTAGSAEGGTMQYALGENGDKAPQSGWSAAVPTGTDVGTYYVWYKVAGDEHHKDTAPVCVTVKISEKPAASKPVALVKATAKGKTALKFKWNKVSGAAKYEVWMAKCGKKSTIKMVKTLRAPKTNWTKKKLKKNTAYKFYVVAKDASGNVICKSVTGHAITGNVRGRYTNAKSLSVSQSSINLNKGGTAKISATQKKAKKGKKLCKHAALLRYTSNNPAVATVDSNGNIKTVDAGSCTVYVQTVNGIWKTVTVNVN